jgi:hypothetical protein
MPVMHPGPERSTAAERLRWVRQALAELREERDA